MSGGWVPATSTPRPPASLLQSTAPSPRRVTCTDLVAGTPRVVVLTEHVARDGSAKIVTECTLPLTGVGVVDRIISDLAVFDITDAGLQLVRLAPGVTLHELRARTEAEFSDARSEVVA